MNKQRIEMDAVKSRHRLSEKRWRDMIADRNKEISELQGNLEDITSKNEKLKEDKSDLSTRLDSEIANKKKLEKKLKKHLKSMQKLKPVASKNESKAIEQPIQGDPKNVNELDCEQDSEQETCTKNKILVDNIDPEINALVQADKGIDEVPAESYHDDETCREESGDPVRQADSAFQNILSSNKDLIGEAKEDWLRFTMSDKKLKANTRQEGLAATIEVPTKVGSGLNLSECLTYHTPMKQRPYNPSDYATDIKRNSTFPLINQTLRDAESVVEGNIKTETRIGTGQKIVRFPNGTTKETLPDGTTIVRFINGDVKTSYANIGTVVYFYAEAKVRNVYCLHKYFSRKISVTHLVFARLHILLIKMVWKFSSLLRDKLNDIIQMG